VNVELRTLCCADDVEWDKRTKLANLVRDISLSLVVPFVREMYRSADVTIR